MNISVIKTQSIIVIKIVSAVTPKDLINSALTKNLTINIGLILKNTNLIETLNVDDLSRQIRILNLYQSDYNLFIYKSTFIEYPDESFNGI